MEKNTVIIKIRASDFLSVKCNYLCAVILKTIAPIVHCTYLD